MYVQWILPTDRVLFATHYIETRFKHAIFYAERERKSVVQTPEEVKCFRCQHCESSVCYFDAIFKRGRFNEWLTNIAILLFRLSLNFWGVPGTFRATLVRSEPATMVQATKLSTCMGPFHVVTTQNTQLQEVANANMASQLWRLLAVKHMITHRYQRWS